MKWPALPFSKSRSRTCKTGVVINAEQLVLAQVDQAPGVRATLGFCHLEANATNHLSKLTRQYDLGNQECHTVMPMGSYHLLLIEAPEVPTNELRAAVRWRIRELIDFHVDDAVLDVFDAPASGARGQTHLYVVVSRSADVKQLADQLQDAGINLSVIDIPELALRNLAAQLPEDEQGVAMLHFGAQRGLMALCRHRTLYLARTLDLGLKRLREAVTDGQIEALFDALALEVQRSLDYYDRQFQQAPITHLLITPLAEPLTGLVESLSGSIGLKVRMLDLAEVVGGADKIPPEQVGECVLAVGAALRSESKTL